MADKVVQCDSKVENAIAGNPCIVRSSKPHPKRAEFFANLDKSPPRPADKDVLPVPVTPETGVYPCAGNARADEMENCGVGTADFGLKRRKRGAKAFLFSTSNPKFGENFLKFFKKKSIIGWLNTIWNGFFFEVIYG